ncbi:hypothetical protein RBWH47_05025 [Rhodopirellula baltica WH47]|uniref:Uncharacterized protein n=1 Tax=Rhodopirellula baltica WH47 TaxID=991778 RepID=F2AYH1_RHOBT|nr:hypothetical protein RBWH47_05025 [Rhodopirellula baltica WH47]
MGSEIQQSGAGNGSQNCALNQFLRTGNLGGSAATAAVFSFLPIVNLTNAAGRGIRNLHLPQRAPRSQRTAPTQATSITPETQPPCSL